MAICQWLSRARLQADLSKTLLTCLEPTLGAIPGLVHGSSVVEQLKAGAAIPGMPAMDLPRTIAGYLHVANATGGYPMRPPEGELAHDFENYFTKLARPDFLWSSSNKLHWHILSPLPMPPSRLFG